MAYMPDYLSLWRSPSPGQLSILQSLCYKGDIHKNGQSWVNNCNHILNWSHVHVIPDHGDVTDGKVQCEAGSERLLLNSPVEVPSRKPQSPKLSPCPSEGVTTLPAGSGRQRAYEMKWLRDTGIPIGLSPRITTRIKRKKKKSQRLRETIFQKALLNHRIFY